MATGEFHHTWWDLSPDTAKDSPQFNAFAIFLLLGFLSTIFLVIFLFFHHCLCYFHHRIFRAPAAPPSVGLDAAAINSLPVFEMTGKTQVEERKCSICLGVFQEEEVIKVIPKCLHAYHSECVSKWLTASSSCPLCRASVETQKPAGIMETSAREE